MQNNKHGFLKLLRHDLQEGMAQNLPKYALCTLFLVMNISMCFFSIRGLELAEVPTFLDLTIYLNAGVQIFSPEDNAIPVEWLFRQVLISFLVYNYLTRDLTTYSLQTLTRIKKRSLWCASKFLWVVCTVALFYIIQFALTFAAAAIFGNPSFGLTLPLLLKIPGVFLNGADFTQVAFAAVVLPFAISVAVALMQVVLELFIKPILAFAAVAALNIITIYYASPFLISNGSMFLRSSLANADGINPAAVTGFLCAYIAIFTALGLVYFRRKDIL
ncbi:MAG: hypothetical protein LBM65_02680 [Oscillospiraceae bacterium]|jgi:hypothetical protein|nr:hypothetical protein [Oscillospiraceae bacterium]